MGVEPTSGIELAPDGLDLGNCLASLGLWPWVWHPTLAWVRTVSDAIDLLAVPSRPVGLSQLRRVATP
jgi:hypothetical protein